MLNLKTLKVDNRFDDNCYQVNKFKIIDSSKIKEADNSSA